MMYSWIEIKALFCEDNSLSTWIWEAKRVILLGGLGLGSSLSRDSYNYEHMNWPQGMIIDAENERDFSILNCPTVYNISFWDQEEEEGLACMD